MGRFFGVFGVAVIGGTVMFVQLPGTVGAVEFVALAGKGEQGNSQQQDGE